MTVKLMSSFSTKLVLLGFILLGATACSSSGNAVNPEQAGAQTTDEKASETQDVATAEEAAKPQEQQAFGKVIENKGTVQNRGGYVRILVNRQPVTNIDIQRRRKFLQLRRAPGDRGKVAEREMIEQVLKLQILGIELGRLVRRPTKRFK